MPPLQTELAYPSVMRCFLGFDGGGTKTHCVLMDDSAKILAQSFSGPSNPTRIGHAAATQSLRDAAEEALRQAGSSFADVEAVCGGLAGTALSENASRMRAALAGLFPSASLQVMTDFNLALATLAPGPAVVLIAGTGSVAVGRDSLGKSSRSGGYGPAGSDEGSAFDLGRAAIETIARANSQSASPPPLARQILRQLGCANWDELHGKCRVNPDAMFPRVFPVLDTAADAGDAHARSLLTDGARKLAALVKNVAAALQLEALPYVLAKTGGMIGRSAFFDSTLDWLLREAAPQARICHLPMAPAEAAARLAIALVRPAQGAAH